MDLSYLNSIAPDRLEELMSISAILDMDLDPEVVASFDDYSREDKKTISRLSGLVHQLAQRHASDFKSFFQNHEYLKKETIEVVQKVVAKFIISENTSTYQ